MEGVWRSEAIIVFFPPLPGSPPLIFRELSLSLPISAGALPGNKPFPSHLKEELRTEKRVKNRKCKKYCPLVYPPPQQPPPLEVEAVVPLDPVIGYIILVYPVRLPLALSLA